MNLTSVIWLLRRNVTRADLCSTYQFKKPIGAYKPTPDWLHTGVGLLAEFIIAAGFLYLIRW